MKQIVQQQRSGRLSVTEVPAPTLKPDGLLVRTAYSLISAGTERSKVEVGKKSLLGKALARPDQVRQVLQSYRQSGFQATFQKVTSKLDALSPMGYSASGVVLAVGERVSGFSPGDHVACAGGGYASHAEILYVPHNLCVRLPANVPLDAAAYTTLGAIALQGVRQASPTLGETIGVTGLGLLGLLTVQLLKANGCRVVGLDIDPGRCKLALQMGADAATTPDDPGLLSQIEQFNPAGLDGVILTAATASSTPIIQAGELCRDRGRVIVVGAVGMDLPRSPFYEKEIDLRLSRSYGPGRYDTNYEEKGQDYPVGYVRWTEGRNMMAFVDLLAQGKLEVGTLTSHCFLIDEAPAAYDLIQGKSKEPYLGVLLDYALPEDLPLEPPAPETVVLTPAASRTGTIGLGLIGAGNFAQSMLLPHLQSHAKVQLRAVVTPSGLSARSVAERAGFAQAGSDPEIVFNDPEVGLVLIASRHDSHADLVVDALEAGKAVFVEKPLALHEEELIRIQEAIAGSQDQGRSPFVMVGFNRRFAPLVVQLREFLASAVEPLLMHFRVNAGYLPLDHWTQDPEIGGGRVLGEVCHFVDLLQFLAGQPPTEVYAQALPDGGRYNRDNLSATLRFANGSVGTITYAANGDRGIAKERLEVFTGGLAAILDDFRQLTLSVGGRKTVKKSKPDKGHQAEMIALIAAISQGSPAPVPFEQSVATTRATFAILKSLSTGQPVSLV